MMNRTTAVVLGLVLLAAMSHWQHERGAEAARIAGAREGYEYGLRWGTAMEDCARVLVLAHGQRRGITGTVPDDAVGERDRAAMSATCTEKVRARLGPAPWESRP